MGPNNPPYPMATPPQGYPQQGAGSMPPPMFPPPQDGMFQVNPEKLQGAGAAAGPSGAYPPPHNAYAPSSSAYPPQPNAYPPHNAYPPQPDAYPPAHGAPVQGYPVNYAQGPPGSAPAGYPGSAPAGYPGAPPAGPPGTMYVAAGPMADDGKAGPIVCVAIVLFIIGIFFPFLWIVVAFMPFCARGQNARTQATIRRIAMMATIALLVYLIIAVILGVMSATRWNRNAPAQRTCWDPITRIAYPCPSG